MEVTIKFFALLREIMGMEEITLYFPTQISCAQVLAFLKSNFTAAAVALDNSLIAVNGEYAFKTAMLNHSDEIAFLPPVSGG